MLQKIKTTEKMVKMIEAENVLVFETDRSRKKQEIKKELESLFKIKIAKVRTHNRKNKKLVYIKLKEGQALDVATKLGVM